MRIYKNCKRLDFSTGSLKICLSLEELRDIDYLMERLREVLSLPPHSMGRD
jgi:hypothetical protein